jgi:hypothetical protein
MATYKTASKQLLDDYACISTLEGTQISVGDTVTVGSLGAPFDGAQTVLACPQYLYAGVDGETGEFFTTPTCLYLTKFCMRQQATMLNLLRSTQARLRLHQLAHGLRPRS